MRVLCCGDRNWTNSNLILDVLLEYKDIPDMVVIHGGASGADFLAGEAAKMLGFKVEVYPADWNKHGRVAGPIRNQKMLDTKPDHVIAFHDNIAISKGTGHMISITKKAEISFEVKTNNG